MISFQWMNGCVFENVNEKTFFVQCCLLSAPWIIQTVLYFTGSVGKASWLPCDRNMLHRWKSQVFKGLSIICLYTCLWLFKIHFKYLTDKVAGETSQNSWYLNNWWICSELYFKVKQQRCIIDKVSDSTNMFLASKLKA